MKRPRGAVFSSSKSEQGFSLTEILVAIGLIAVISTVVVAVMLNANKVSQNSTASALTQQELLAATTRVTNEVASASKFIIAEENRMVVLVEDDNVEWEVSYFAYNPSNSDTAYGLDPSLLPDEPAIMELRHHADGTGEDIVSTIVPGYQQTPSIPVFSYFDAGNVTPLVTPVPEDKLTDIKRVSFRFTSFAEGRDAPMELVTSITPRTILGLAADAGNVFGITTPEDTLPESIVLTGTLPSRTTTAALSWESIENAAAYTLSRTDLATGLVSVVYTGPNTSFSNSGLVRGKAYGYKVTATATSNATVDSNVLNLTATPPAPVIAVSAVDLVNTISWTPVTGASQYRVYLDGNATALGTVTGNSYAHTASHAVTASRPAYGATRTYYVVAVNAQGDASENSNKAAAVSPPVAPTLVGSHENGNRHFEWNNVANSDKFEVKRILPNAATFAYGNDVITGNDFQETAGATFTYQVRAANGAGWGPWSNVLTLNPNPGVPVVTGSHSNGSRIVSWNDSANSTLFQVQRVEPGLKTWVPTTTLSMTDSETPAEAVVWRYQVRAYNISGWSAWSSPVSILPLPAAPTMSGSHSNGIRTVTYGTMANATKYQLRRTAPTSKLWEGDANYRGGADSEAIDAPTFTYSARAGNIAGWGPWSTAIDLNPRPAAPSVTGQDFASHPGTRDGNNYMAWTAPANATSYRYSRNYGDGPGSWSSTTANSWTDTGPGWNSSNNYYAVACNITGCSGADYVNLRQPAEKTYWTEFNITKRSGSDKIQGTATDMPLTKALVDMDWSVSSGRTGYTVWREKTGEANKALVNNGLVGTINDTTPVSGTTYRYYVKVHGTYFIRDAMQANIQLPPAQVYDLKIRPQTLSNRQTTRYRAWSGSSRAVEGGQDLAQAYTFRVDQTTDGAAWGIKNGKWDTNWAGEVLTITNSDGSGWNAGAVGSFHGLGGGIVARSVRNIESGFNSGVTYKVRTFNGQSVTQATNQESTASNVSTLIQATHIRKANETMWATRKMWDGTYSSSTTYADVVYNTSNYPASTANFYQVQGS